AGATATRANQQVFGTASNTYTMPGITSDASKAAQGSPTNIVTSNASGDLAAYTPSQLGIATSSEVASLQSNVAGLQSNVAGLQSDVTGLQSDVTGLQSGVGGLQKAINRVGRDDERHTAGVAQVLRHQKPDVTRDERFGITANWGDFKGANAFGMGLEGVLAHDLLARGDRVAVTGGWGVGFAEGGGSNVYGGRVGLQWTH